MNKFITIAVILFASFMIAKADPFTVAQENGEKFKIFENEAPENWREFRIMMELNHNLHLLDTATTICFQTDETFALEDGAFGFGMSFLCAIHECTSNTHLHALLFGSHYEDSGIWAGAGKDASHTNRGVVELDSGLHPDTKYVMSDTLSYEIHAPNHIDEVDQHFKCFSRFDGSYFEDNLLVDIKLNENWEMHEVTIPAHHHEPEEEDEITTPPPA